MMLFAYVSTEDDTIEIMVDEQDVAALTKLTGNRKAIYDYLVAIDDECPTIEEITNVEVELHDDAQVALCEGNETIEIWF
jgi:hypothetical protein